MKSKSIAQHGWLIIKAGRGWYRANAEGYTVDPRDAGRFSYEDAVWHSHPNGPNGTRDGILMHHESTVPGSGACANDKTESLNQKIARLELHNRQLQEAVKLFQAFGCPACQGDCGNANPPVSSCPMQIAEAAITGKH